MYFLLRYDRFLDFLHIAFLVGFVPRFGVAHYLVLGAGPGPAGHRFLVR